MERRRPGPALLLALPGTTLLGAPSVVVTSLGGGRALVGLIGFLRRPRPPRAGHDRRLRAVPPS